RIVDVDGRLARADADATERNVDVAVGAKHPLRCRKLGQRVQALDRIGDGLQCAFAVGGLRSIAAITVVHLASLSFSGITRIRFKGSRLPFRWRLSACGSKHPLSSPSYGIPARRTPTLTRRRPIAKAVEIGG